MGALDGKVAVVTGAGRGIGRGHALLLASEGARVMVNDLGGEWDGTGADTRHAQQVVDEVTKAGGEAAANYDDVADWEGAQRLVNQAIETWGDLNILVNNAGILRDRMSFNMSEEDWDSVIRVHLKGHFAPSRFAAVYWRERSKAGDEVYGRIVNTSSESGLCGNAGQANYAAAKAGIASLTIVLARELEKYGVTVNAIAPRARTRMTEGTFEGFGASGEGGFDEMHPDNIAPLIGFLASPAATDVSGQVFVLWGGQINRMGGWHTEATIDKGDRWTVEELAAKKADLFGPDGGKIPAMSF
ncbi:MAG: SDR family NAD(P)-dependent oxidoreductase [Actinobacteria bacterium]|nr:SDR family NAD(P)-dependent oxidoreductase [Actinomycetota bacterium]